MPFTRNITNQNSKEITVEFPDDWNAYTNLIDSESKENFFQHLFERLRQLVDELGIYQFKFVSISQSEANNYFNVGVHDISHSKNIIMLRIPCLVNEEKNHDLVKSTFSLSLELGINHRVFEEWKADYDRLTLLSKESFEKIEEELTVIFNAFNKLKLPFVKNNGHPQFAEMRAWFDNDAIINGTLPLIVQTVGEIREKMQKKSEQIATLKPRLNNIVNKLYRDYTQKKQKEDAGWIQQCADIKKNLVTLYSSILKREHADVCEVIYFCDRNLEYLEKLLTGLSKHIKTKKPNNPEFQFEYKLPSHSVLFPALGLSFDSASSSVKIEGDKLSQSQGERSLYRLIF